PRDRAADLAHDQRFTTLAMFGIWKAGAAYCPLNLNYTKSLLRFQIKDVAPALLIVEASMESQIGEAAELYGEFHPFLAGLEELLAPAMRPRAEPGYDQVAAIVYTSGTTGKPKGALLTHRWINQMTFYLRKLITQDDTIYNDLPLYHVGGAFC